MQMDDEPTPEQLKQIAKFVSTLQRPPSIDVARGSVDTQAIQRGKQVFASNCHNCPRTSHLYNKELFDVGLTDKEGTRYLTSESNWRWATRISFTITQLRRLKVYLPSMVIRRVSSVATN